jgi:hypothetical protein
MASTKRTVKAAASSSEAKPRASTKHIKPANSATLSPNSKVATAPKGRRPGSPLAGTGSGPRRSHRSATGSRLGPGSVSGGV